MMTDAQRKNLDDTVEWMRARGVLQLRVDGKAVEIVLDPNAGGPAGQTDEELLLDDPPPRGPTNSTPLPWPYSEAELYPDGQVPQFRQSADDEDES